ncbi:class I SAM-dependent methyltransferase [Cohnella thailandensis]|uniref:Class I SAM-dependent methyltransferase n=1 Tax=Cohnella thailandensis TaxID=557557 RepID=A0A841T1R9_9BACL|nr:class I SAM-dependent methyltransferase [Cohnella thailandensis]MBB6636515.1 class I SAM-dependent methyltransferase [Cohnella thailandensis]MBP1977613.1 16S rRNA (guanine1207-N2)-methyltransferase [Cohnella thailandensis]
MSEHYYTREPQTASDRKSLTAELRGFKLQLTSDAGVFSRDGVDYGSRVLIEHMDIPADASVLDLGCGYGPIGLTAARLAPRGHVTMVDINERAVSLAAENAKRNGIANISAMQSDIYAAVEGRRFDVILSNPPIRAGKVVVHRILTEAAEHLNPGGSLWIVIQNKQGAPSARAKLEEVFGEEQVEEIGKDKGYRIYRAKLV